jgi:uncharacterized membrane protein YhaH (DUF805 family)
LLQFISFATLSPIIAILLIIWTLFLMIPQISVQVRRLHDLNRSGLWLLMFYGLYFLAAIFIFFGIILIEMGNFGGSGMMIILFLVICIGVPIWQIVWYCLPPVDQDNRFGPNPLLMSASSPLSPASATPQPKATRVSQNPVPSAPLASETTSSASVNDRLRDLNKMYEDGLIDEKEFKSKKKKLLDEL